LGIINIIKQNVKPSVLMQVACHILRHNLYKIISHLNYRTNFKQGGGGFTHVLLTIFLTHCLPIFFKLYFQILN
ncbi:hypothetical protein ACJX0J_029905, partial [Zea mays]